MFTTSFSSSIGSSNVYEFDAVDIRPEFPGGERALFNFINGEKRYPADAYSAGIEGRVLISFIIAADGTVSNATVVRGVDDSLNREAVRVVNLMPKWTPGKVDGETVNVRHVITIVFRL
ncbi:MAG: energy transducer TonB [Muribaculaceae bacterium]|nr:energy transducer TonB [Muribaculaceae bacterium]